MVLNEQVAPWTPISPAFKFLFYKGNKLVWEGPKNIFVELYEHADGYNSLVAFSMQKYSQSYQFNLPNLYSL